jgi:asparagine synthase (glutamine-hydrolysing)
VCGIAGLIGRRDESVEGADVHRMCQTIVHRGPDDEGIYAKGSAGLGMRRLSIIDLAGGRQPIHNEDKSVWVVFNGEIYNFPELRQELEGRGHRFYTHSDTEVIVHLYEEMGTDCVKKLRGMFAIALYDERKQSLLLARDRLGKKPLHYALHEGRLLFGSEIKAILAIAPELAEVKTEGLLQYLYFGYIPDPHTERRNQDSGILGRAGIRHASSDVRRGMPGRTGATAGGGCPDPADQRRAAGGAAQWRR